MANPRGYPPKSEAFGRRQRATQDYFGYYRTVGDGNWDPQARRHHIARRTQPDPSYAGPGFPQPGTQAVDDLAAQAESNHAQFRLGAQNAGVPRAAQLFTRDTLNADSFRDRLRDAGIRFVKVLGWGGNGMATLWHVRETRTDASTGTTRDVDRNVVLKNHYNTPTSINSLRNERRIMSILARSPHIMQRVHHVGRIANAAPGADAAAASAAARLDADENLLWTEIMKHKDLDSLLRKVGSANESFPVSVLWHVFKCLVEAVTAMAYPPRFQAAPPHPEMGPDLIEGIPPLSTQDNYDNIIHFDLDPQNVFLDDLDAGEHIQLQRVRLGDFGHSKTPADFANPPGAYNNYEAIWDSRMLGKEKYYLPEQFTKEWDQVNYEPYSEGFTVPIANGRGTAGAYTELSNIWSIAQLMWCCITLCEPTVPPQPEQNPPDLRWTYGGDLNDQASVDDVGEDLCGLLVRCLMHCPQDRPSLSGLRAAVAAGVLANPITPEDSQWIRKMALGPPSASRLPTFPMRPRVDLGGQVPVFDDGP